MTTIPSGPPAAARATDTGPQLGRLIEDGDRRRDAVHVAVAAVTAAVHLTPGQHVGLVREGDLELVGPCDRPVGIVDPFLRGEIPPGGRFWLFLYPGTISGLRHIWTHPSFTAAAAAGRQKLAPPAEPPRAGVGPVTEPTGGRP